MSRNDRRAVAVTGCVECGHSFEPRRADQITCSNACRQRRHRRGSGAYVVTDADRAAIARVRLLVPIPTPGRPHVATCAVVEEVE